jgi:hypothetical protein
MSQITSITCNKPPQIQTQWERGQSSNNSYDLTHQQMQNTQIPQRQSEQQTHSPQQNKDQQEPSPSRKPSFFVYPEKSIHEGINACQNSILGKIITEKPIHISSIQNGLDNIWGSPEGLNIQEIEKGIIQFFMSKSYDQKRILLGNP